MTSLLVPCDGSASALQAVRHAATVAVESQLDIELLHVVEPMTPATFSEAIAARRLDERFPLRAVEALRTAAGILDQAGVGHTLHCRNGQTVALLFLDLDNFKDLNDLHGHAAGDRLLRQAGARISACTRAADTVARLGGDEFVILLENAGLGEDEAMRHVAAAGWKVIAAIREPFDLGGMTHHATCSLGATLRAAGAADFDADSLMKRGDMACTVPSAMVGIP